LSEGDPDIECCRLDEYRKTRQQAAVNRWRKADFRVVIVGISVSKHSNDWQILDKQVHWQDRLASPLVVSVL
jgi:hypothetical protein